MPEKPLVIIAVIEAEAGHEETLRAAQLRLVEATRKEDGCLRYELNQSLDDGRVLIFVEAWTTEAAWEAHMNGAAMAAFRAEGVDPLIRRRTLHRMTQVSD